MSTLKTFVLAALAVFAVPFSARADLVIGVGVPGPFYRPYHHRWYRPYAVVVPPLVVVPPPPVVVAPPPRVIYVAPQPGTVIVAPPLPTTYVVPAAPAPAPVVVPR